MRPGCGSPEGSCEPRPTSCGVEESPVCGCDGIIYFNDCLRRARGVPAAQLTECFPIALLCGAPFDPPCPPGSFCGKLLPADAPACPPEAPGMCWGLPTCGADPSGVERWAPCVGPPRCVDTCSAIRSETPHVPFLCAP